MTENVETPLAKIKQKLFVKDEVNTGRQIEFDVAKVVCLIGMVIVHGFDEFSMHEIAEGSTTQFVIDVVLDYIFGAGTFMACMGLGIAYSWKGRADMLIKRGISIFILGYILNVLRLVLPYFGLTVLGFDLWTDMLVEFLSVDILQFAGLALFLFGLLKKFKLSDLGVFLIALAMSIGGSFIRCWDLGGIAVNELCGLFIGTMDPYDENTISAFPLINWFIIVVGGFLYGKYLRRCTNLNKFYAISFPVTGALLAIYMGIAIPNNLGMMNDDVSYFYHMDTLSAAVMLTGAVFASGLYHFISRFFNETVRRVVIRLSSNINSFYCIHWVIIGWISAAFIYFDYKKQLDDSAVLWLSIGIIIVSAVLADVYRNKLKKKKHKAVPAEEERKAVTAQAVENVAVNEPEKENVKE